MQNTASQNCQQQNRTGTGVYTCGCPPPCSCVSGMYTEEDGRTTVQSKAQDDDSRRVRNYTRVVSHFLTKWTHKLNYFQAETCQERQEVKSFHDPQVFRVAC